MNALVVINPNSSQAVTDGIDIAIDPLRSFGIPIRCLTLAEGPPGIESQQQADLTIPPMLKLAAHVTHWALYALMILLPIGGGMAWFGGKEFAAELHGAMAPVLMVLILLHFAGALFHQFVLKTNLLDRMRTPG